MNYRIYKKNILKSAARILIFIKEGLQSKIWFEILLNLMELSLQALWTF